MNDSVRAVIRFVWWSTSGPFLCTGLLLVGLYDIEPLRVLGPILGAAVFLVSGLSIWQMLVHQGRPGVELARCLLLALPPSYLPTLLLHRSELTRLVTEHVLAPAPLAVWGTVYGVWVVALFLARRAPEDAPDERAEATT